jgi:hypothetical protein
MCNDMAEPFDRARVRCVLPERSVSSRVIIIGSEFRENSRGCGLCGIASASVRTGLKLQRPVPLVSPLALLALKLIATIFLLVVC